MKKGNAWERFGEDNGNDGLLRRNEKLSSGAYVKESHARLAAE